MDIAPALRARAGAVADGLFTPLLRQGLHGRVHQRIAIFAGDIGPARMRSQRAGKALHRGMIEHAPISLVRGPGLALLRAQAVLHKMLIRASSIAFQATDRNHAVGKQRARHQRGKRLLVLFIAQRREQC